MDKNILDQFKSNKVLVVGDVMLDKYLTGSIDRISPEAPVPIVNLKNREARLGGAANVTLSLKALEVEPILFSVIGKDQEGEKIKHILKEKDISSEYLFESSCRRTTSKSRILASNQQILRVDEEDTFPLSKEEESALLTAVTKYIDTNDVSVIIFQDYNKGVLTANVIKQIIEKANSKNIPTVVDPKKENFWAYQGVTCFKPNLKEIKAALNIDIQPNEASLDQVHKSLNEKLNNSISLITLSEHGIYYGSADETHLKPTQSRKIADVCGAGDAVVAIISLCIANGLKADTMCKLANIVGGQVCERVGVVPIEKTALCRELGI